MRNIAAHTHFRHDSCYPAYVSINEHADGSVSVTVRSPESADPIGSAINLTADEYRAFAVSIAKYELDRERK